MPNAPKPVSKPIVRPVDLRPSATQRGYDRTWQRLAALVLAEEPLCRRCHEAGRTQAAELVDHIVPLNEGGARLDRSNLQPLCRTCHAVKTAADTKAREVRP